MNFRLSTCCLLAAALGLPVTAPLAIELYGNAHVSLDAISNGDGEIEVGGETVEAKKNALLISSNKSYIGLRGREVLRERLALIWQYEQGVDLDDGEWSEGRDSYVGLDGRAGTLLAGRHVTPYRRMTDHLDIFRNTRADHSAVLGAVDGVSLFNERARNTVYYATPENRRLRFALAYISSRDHDTLPRSRSTADRNGFSTSLVFDSGPLYLGIGWERLGQDEAVYEDDAEATKIALAWDFGQGTKASLIWEDADDGSRVGGRKGSREAWYAALSHVSGNFTWKLAYGMLDDLAHTPDSGAQMIAAGFSWAMSPRTEFYLLGATVLNDDNASYGLQPDHDDRGPDGVATPGIPAAAEGENVVTLSAGFIHRFRIDL